MWSSTQILSFYFFLSTVIFLSKSNRNISLLITSIHISLGLPLLLSTPSCLHPSIFLTGTSLRLLYICPTQRKRFSLILDLMDVTPIFSRMILFLTMSFLVCPHIYHNIRISTTFIF
jgi:hypothetical protein